MSEELKSCPFCGGSVDIFKLSDALAMNGSWNIDCYDCGLTMREDFILGKEEAKTEKSINKAWNTRPLEQTTEEIEAGFHKTTEKLVGDFTP